MTLQETEKKLIHNKTIEIREKELGLIIYSIPILLIKLNFLDSTYAVRVQRLSIIIKNKSAFESVPCKLIEHIDDRQRVVVVSEHTSSSKAAGDGRFPPEDSLAPVTGSV